MLLRRFVDGEGEGLRNSKTIVVLRWRSARIIKKLSWCRGKLFYVLGERNA
jgi:hypothetical protein